MTASFTSSSAPTKPRLPTLDVQARPDDRGIALQQAGIRGVELPWAFCDQPQTPSQPIALRLDLTVGLPSATKGAHMSRFVRCANQWRTQKPFALNQLPLYLADLSQALESSAVQLAGHFTWFMDKPAPVSQHSAPMGYAIGVNAQLNQGLLTTHLTLAIPIATLCPCSKEISDYGAHNQRAFLTVTLDIAAEALDSVFLTQLIPALEATASCPVFPILKREDEKWVTERQYDNPKFVEDVARDAVLVLQRQSGFNGFCVSVEALESIHAHNAYAQTAMGSLANTGLWQGYRA
ncbi:MAG: GTP cyclohydrolase FolE2 [Vampirovibrionales bacterium]